MSILCKAADIRNYEDVKAMLANTKEGVDFFEAMEGEVRYGTTVLHYIFSSNDQDLIGYTIERMIREFDNNKIEELLGKKFGSRTPINVLINDVEEVDIEGLKTIIKKVHELSSENFSASKAFIVAILNDSKYNLAAKEAIRNYMLDLDQGVGEELSPSIPFGANVLEEFDKNTIEDLKNLDSIKHRDFERVFDDGKAIAHLVLYDQSGRYIYYKKAIDENFIVKTDNLNAQSVKFIGSYCQRLVADIEHNWSLPRYSNKFQEYLDDETSYYSGFDKLANSSIDVLKRVLFIDHDGKPKSLNIPDFRRAFDPEGEVEDTYPDPYALNVFYRDAKNIYAAKRYENNLSNLSKLYKVSNVVYYSNMSLDLVSNLAKIYSQFCIDLTEGGYKPDSICNNNFAINGYDVLNGAAIEYLYTDVNSIFNAASNVALAIYGSKAGFNAFAVATSAKGVNEITGKGLVSTIAGKVAGEKYADYYAWEYSVAEQFVSTALSVAVTCFVPGMDRGIKAIPIILNLSSFVVNTVGGTKLGEVAVIASESGALFMATSGGLFIGWMFGLLTAASSATKIFLTFYTNSKRDEDFITAYNKDIEDLINEYTNEIPDKYNQENIDECKSNLNIIENINYDYSLLTLLRIHVAQNCDDLVRENWHFKNLLNSVDVGSLGVYEFVKDFGYGVTASHIIMSRSPQDIELYFNNMKEYSNSNKHIIGDTLDSFYQEDNLGTRAIDLLVKANTETIEAVFANAPVELIYDILWEMNIHNMLQMNIDSNFNEAMLHGMSTNYEVGSELYEEYRLTYSSNESVENKDTPDSYD